MIDNFAISAFLGNHDFWTLHLLMLRRKGWIENVFRYELRDLRHSAFNEAFRFDLQYNFQLSSRTRLVACLWFYT